MAIQKPTTASVRAESTFRVKYVVIGALILIAFFASYRIAQASSAQGPTTSSAPAGYATTAVTGAGGAGAAGGSGSGCACCGSTPAPASAQAPKEAAVAGSVQKIAVDVSKGYYDPSNIVLKAGIPAEITFSQSSGCTAQVMSQTLGFQADLTGGPQTVRIDDPQPGEYDFYCGMQMVFGKIVVK